MAAEAVLYVADLDRMVPFYESCLAFAVEDRSESHAVLRSPHWMLQMVRVPADVAAEIAITVPPQRRDRVPVKLVFLVPDIDALGSSIERLGGVLDPATSRRTFGGFARHDALDPEGNVIQLLEPASD